jgi:cytochrome c oxidase subunit II
MPGFPLFPVRASAMAGRVDALFFFLIGVSAFFAILIAVLIVVFGIRYRRRSAAETGTDVQPPLALEVAWIVIPTAITMVMFVWGARLYFTTFTPPTGQPLDVYVVAKQWMWKFQHVEGRREIDELHIPMGRPIRLTMTSEDVLHAFFVPAFRVKRDVIPGRYVTLWFTATKVGRYHLFCSEYCGTKHSGMTGTVIVMTPAEYQAWLGGASPGGTPSLADAGAKLFTDLACVSCHLANGTGRGPSLAGLFGKSVTLSTGQVVKADEGYIRESILDPGAKIVAGYQPLMPTFRGLVSEEQLNQLIEYIKSLGAQQGTQPASAAPAGPAPPAGAQPSAAPPK